MVRSPGYKSCLFFVKKSCDWEAVMRKLILVLLAMPFAANADVIGTGSIYTVGTEPPFFTTIDWWRFTVNTVDTTGGWEVGVIGSELSFYNNETTPVDFNGDGEITFIDLDVYLWALDTTHDEVYYRGFYDDWYGGRDDGSVYAGDPYLTNNAGTGFLETGDFILAVGIRGFTPGSPSTSAGPYRPVAEQPLGYPKRCRDYEIGGSDCGYLQLSDHADYSITIYGDITVTSDPGSTFQVPVPEPGTLALFTIGLAGMGLARRKKKA